MPVVEPAFCVSVPAALPFPELEVWPVAAAFEPVPALDPLCVASGLVPEVLVSEEPVPDIDPLVEPAVPLVLPVEPVLPLIEPLVLPVEGDALLEPV